MTIVETCHKCNKTYTQSSNLQTPKVNNHERVTRNGDQCEHTASTKHDLRTHELKNKVTEEKPNTCQQCGKSYTHSGNIRTHKMTHRGEKPYTYKQCKIYSIFLQWSGCCDFAEIKTNVQLLKVMQLFQCLGYCWEWTVYRNSVCFSMPSLLPGVDSISEFWMSECLMWRFGDISYNSWYLADSVKIHSIMASPDL